MPFTIKHRLRALALIACVAATAGGVPGTSVAGLANGTPHAAAAAFAYGVYAPNRINSFQIRGWANHSITANLAGVL